MVFTGETKTRERERGSSVGGGIFKLTKSISAFFGLKQTKRPEDANYAVGSLNMNDRPIEDVREGKREEYLNSVSRCSLDGNIQNL